MKTNHDTTGSALLEAMLHPVRLKALGALSRGELTTGELADLLDGVAASSLYRHMKALRDAGLVTVTERRPTRGALGFAVGWGAHPLLPGSKNTNKRRQW